MALVFRTDQSIPLTNDQVDNNFKYLRDQVNLKYNISDVTAANLSLKLRTTAANQTTLALSQANAINAWLLRDLEPLSGVPVITDKSSIVARNSSGGITVSTVTGALTGNADTATLAASATKLATARTINGVSFDGTANISVADASKLPLSGGTLSGKLILSASQSLSASINFGASATSPDTGNKANGDVWATTSGLFYHIQGQTDQVSPIASPTFTGIPKAPGYSGIASQIITLTHLDNATTTLNTAIALKANIASPTFTGAAKAPTPASSSNDTTLATTAYVTSGIANKASDITTAYQTSISSAIATYNTTVNQSLALKANIDSPTFTGIPTTITPTTGNNSTQIANTAFITSAIATYSAIFNAEISALKDSIASTRPVPVGSVFYIVTSTVPFGYLEANGQSVSREIYSLLWQLLGRPNTGNGSTTFSLPDLRGEFIRGWDHERGIDTNRILGSIQYGSFEEHQHAYVDTYYRESDNYGGSGNRGIGSRATDYDNEDFNYNRTTAKTGGNETRPRNVALMPIIKW
jgi:hypothetical protein